MSLRRQVFGLLILAGFALVPALALASDTVLKRFDVGSGTGAVGVVDASEDTEIEGPQAIYAGADGEIYLLDKINGRILKFDKKDPEQTTQALELPQDLQQAGVTDLVVVNGELYVWSGEVRAVRPTGPEGAAVRGLEEYATRGVEDELVTSAFAQMGSQEPEAEPGADDNTRSVARKREARPSLRQSVASRGKGPVVASIVPASKNDAARIVVRPRGAEKPLASLQLQVPDRLGAVELLEIDRGGRLFVLAENIPETGEAPSTFVARYSPMGKLEGIHELPLAQNATNARRFVTVDPDGDVYFLRTRKGGADVLGVGFRAMRGNAITVGAGAMPVSDPFARRKGGPVAAVRPLTRQRVIEAAFAFERIPWTVSPGNYGRDPDNTCTGFNRVRRPGFLHGKVGQTVRGVPYCWGCMGSLTQIKQRFDRGMLAGNWCTRNEPRRDVAGVDCSAFVSATWGLATHFTTRAIPAITKPLSDAWSLLPGDALNRPGSHVMLFLRFTPDRKVEVMEAATGSCNGRVCRNIYPLGALLARGYTPVRYRALVSDTTAQVAYPDQQEAKAKAAKGGKKVDRKRKQNGASTSQRRKRR